MERNIRRVDYFNTTVKGVPGESYTFLAQLGDESVNLLAFSAIPLGPESAQLSLFPDNVEKMMEISAKEGLTLDGPHPALLVQGDDRLGAVASIHSRLLDAGVHVFASTGVTDGAGGFGYILYVPREEIDRAVSALERQELHA